MGIGIGELIDDKYEIVRLIGKGGTGAVYEGKSQLIGRRVAIKILHHNTHKVDPSSAKRFQREAQAAGRFGGDHILEIIDMGSLPSGEHFIVMEYLEGETLAERIQRLGRISPRELQPILTQALEALSAAHRAGIVHRNLKPDNIFILQEKTGTPDFVKLIDFGISKFTAPDQEMSMTETGMLFGTPYYMSPEQATGASGINQQTDIYSLGVIAFEALTGRVPYDATTFNDLMFKIVFAELPRPEDLVAGLDPALSAIVRRAMERSLPRRFQSAEEFLAALDRWSPMAITVSDGTPMSAQGIGLTSSPSEPSLTEEAPVDRQSESEEPAQEREPPIFPLHDTVPYDTQGRPIRRTTSPAEHDSRSTFLSATTTGNRANSSDDLRSSNERALASNDGLGTRLPVKDNKKMGLSVAGAIIAVVTLAAIGRKAPAPDQGEAVPKSQGVPKGPTTAQQQDRQKAPEDLRVSKPTSPEPRSSTPSSNSRTPTTEPTESPVAQPATTSPKTASSDQSSDQPEASPNANTFPFHSEQKAEDDTRPTSQPTEQKKSAKPTNDTTPPPTSQPAEQKKSAKPTNETTPKTEASRLKPKAESTPTTDSPEPSDTFLDFGY